MSIPVRRLDGAARILVIEANRALREDAEQHLVEAGFDVVTAETAAAALTMFSSVTPDIVLVALDADEAFDTCTQIRLMDGGEHVPLVAMTSRTEPDFIALAFARGATDIIEHPPRYTVLTHRLDYMVRASRSSDALRDSERRLAVAQRIAKIGHWEWAVGFEEVELSAEARRILGVPEDLALTLDGLMTIVAPDDRSMVLEAIDGAVEKRVPLRIEHRIHLADSGEPRIVYQDGVVGREETSGVLRVIATIQDITDQKQAEWRIHHLTNYDAATGLPNKRAVSDGLGMYIAAAQKTQSKVGVLAIDPDQFKRLNDSLGHATGDELLRAYAERLGAALRRRGGTQPMLGRTGSVGFVAVIPDVENAHALETIARQIGQDIAVPFELDDKRVYITSSFGLALYPNDGNDATAMLEAAALALSSAKRIGRGSICFNDDAGNRERIERFETEAKLRTALETDGLSLVYQPKVRTKGHGLVGVEALIRWTDPDLGFVSPGVFIPLAEECGLIGSIDTWVLRRACQDAVRWTEAGFDPLCVSINVSAEQFAKPGFVKLVLDVLQSSGLPPEQLELELTERTLMKDSDGSIEILETLRSHGIRVAIDDFGTGYSSLSYLTRFPIDALKIDRSFVTDVHEHQERAAIVRAIVAMSKSLGLHIVAEGVETEEELDFLASHDCDEIQGYYFAKPMPPAAFLEWRGAKKAG